MDTIIQKMEERFAPEVCCHIARWLRRISAMVCVAGLLLLLSLSDNTTLSTITILLRGGFAIAAIWQFAYLTWDLDGLVEYFDQTVE